MKRQPTDTRYCQQRYAVSCHGGCRQTGVDNEKEYAAAEGQTSEWKGRMGVGDSRMIGRGTALGFVSSLPAAEQRSYFHLSPLLIALINASAHHQVPPLPRAAILRLRFSSP